MTEASSTPATGPFSILGNLFVAPAEAFASILARPNALIPLGLIIALSLLFTAVWSPRVNLGEMQKAQLIEKGWWEKMPPEARDQVMARKPGLGVWLGATLMSPTICLILGGYFLLIYRFFYGGEVVFRQSLAIVSWTFAVASLLMTPMMLLVFLLKGDWNIPPDQVIQANLTLLLEKGATSKVLWSLAGSLDIFSLWMVYLLSSGFALAVRKPLSTAMWGVGMSWLFVVAFNLALAAIF